MKTQYAEKRVSIFLSLKKNQLFENFQSMDE